VAAEQSHFDFVAQVGINFFVLVNVFEDV